MRRNILKLLPVLAVAVVTFVTSAAVLKHDRPDTPKPGLAGPQTANTLVTAAQDQG